MIKNHFIQFAPVLLTKMQSKSILATELDFEAIDWAWSYRLTFQNLTRATDRTLPSDLIKYQLISMYLNINNVFNNGQNFLRSLQGRKDMKHVFCPKTGVWNIFGAFCAANLHTCWFWLRHSIHHPPLEMLKLHCKRFPKVLKYNCIRIPAILLKEIMLSFNASNYNMIKDPTDAHFWENPCR